MMEIFQLLLEKLDFDCGRVNDFRAVAVKFRAVALQFRDKP